MPPYPISISYGLSVFYLFILIYISSENIVRGLLEKLTILFMADYVMVQII